MEEFKNIWQEWMHLGEAEETQETQNQEESILQRIRKIEKQRKRQFQAGLFILLSTLLVYIMLLVPFGISLFQILGMISIGIGGYILLKTYREDTLELSQDDFALNIQDFCLQVRERYNQRARHVVTTPLTYALFLYIGIHMVIHPFLNSLNYYGGIIGAYYGFTFAALGFILNELVKRFRKNEQVVLGSIREFLWHDAE